MLYEMSSEGEYEEECEWPQEDVWIEEKKMMIMHLINIIDEIKERGSLNDEEYIAKVYKLLCKYNKRCSHSIFDNLDALYEKIL